MDSLNFHLLYSQYAKRLIRLAYSVIKDRFLAEDIVQETFLKAYKKMDTIHDSKKVSAWLSQITTRTAIDFLRAERKKQCLPSENIFIEKQISQNDGKECTTEHEVEIRMFKSDLNESLQKLSQEYKEVLVLNIQFGLKEKEIATKLQLNGATVKNRLHRGRKQLKKALLEKYPA